jgi:hypothetical protein
MFLFPRSLALESRPKALIFESSIGNLSVKAAFDVMEMSRGGGSGL